MEVKARNIKMHKCDVSQYDSAYTVAIAILRLVGIRLQDDDSHFIRRCRSFAYWFEFANLVLVAILEIAAMIHTARGGTFDDAVEIFRTLPTAICSIMAMTKSYKFVYQRPVYVNLVRELRSMWPAGDVTDEEHKILTTALRQLHYVVQGYFWCNVLLAFIFIGPSMADMVKRAFGHEVPMVLLLNYWLPFDPYRHGLFEALLFTQTWHCLMTIMCMVSGDMFFCIFLSQVTMQFDLLSVRIRKLVYVPVDKQMLADYPLGEDNGEHLSKEGADIERLSLKMWEQRHQAELAQIVVRHQALIRLSEDIENLFSFSLLVNFLNSSLILCFCGFCCVIVEKWNEPTYKSFLATALSQTGLLCWYGQRLLDSSTGVAESLYNSGWYQASQKTKSSMVVMLTRSQKVVHVTTYGFSIVCLASYAMIIKTSWSYFTILLNFYHQ